MAHLPTNDNIANPDHPDRHAPAPSLGSNVAASKEKGEPDHAGNAGGASVWYQWTAPDSGSYTFTTSGTGTNFDTLLDVYTGNQPSARWPPWAAMTMPGTAVTSSVTFSATAGTIYTIAVDGYDGATGSIELTWEEDSSRARRSPISRRNPARPATRIVISGANLLGVQTGDLRRRPPRAFTANSDNQITATVPNGATTGPDYVHRARPAPR